MLNKIKGLIKLDGWENLFTGLGIQGKDKRLGSNIKWNPIKEADAEELYAQDDIAKKIVNKIPEEALRQGFKINGVTPEQAQKIMRRYDELNGNHSVEFAWKLGRLHGGAAIVLITDNTEDLAEPIVLEDVSQIKALTVLNRWELISDFNSIQRDITQPKFGYPTRYSIRSRIQQTVMQDIHASRLIIFDGLELTARMRMINFYWNDSVLTSTQNAIMNYSTSHDSVAQIIQDFRVGVFRMKDLADKIAEGQGDLVQKRLELINLSKSIINSIVIDADSEEFDYKVTSVAGLQELIDKIEGRLASAADMPRTILFGESPSGLGGTGNHEQNNFYDDVKAEQSNYLKPKHVTLIKLIAQTIGIPTDEIDIEYNPLYQQDDSEIATTRKTNAEADQIYVNTGVLEAREVAVSRFGGDKYGMDIQLDDSLDRDNILPPADPAQGPANAIASQLASPQPKSE